jgi:superfamily II DNA/RNA helicase
MRRLFPLHACRRRHLSTFSALGVREPFLSRLAALGISSPTPVQAAALPHLLSGGSAVVCAETGSGKTLTYLLPLLEALRARLETHDRAAQLTAVGLVVVPSAELAAQVHGVACALLPEHANIIRLCAGAQGASRRQNAGLLIATPHGAVENVNRVHLEALACAVFDEADALLGGGFSQLVREQLLRPFKMVPPEKRPAHVFCAATVPARGRAGAAAFLDKFYPPPAVARIATGGSHRAAPALRQAFWQVDAALPLTRGERERAERLRAAAQRLAEEEALLAAAPARAGAPGAEEEGEEEEEGEGEEGEEEEEEGAAEWEGEGWAGEGGGAEAEGGSRNGRIDAVARKMAGRAAEDRYLALLEEEKRHEEKVWQLVEAATVEALLRPAKEGGLLAAGAGAGEGEGEGAAGGEAAPRSHRSGHRAALGEDLLPGLAPSRKRARAAVLAARGAGRAGAAVCEAAVAAAPAAAAEPPPPAPPAWLLPFSPPLGAARARLSPALSALVPPTLVFVNSCAAAGALRRALAAACPHFRVSELHAELSEAVRLARLADFAAGATRVLVCTNVAARGLDTVNVAHVVQAQFASDAVAHLHRVGRTARAGGGAGGGMATALVTRGSLHLAGRIAGAQARGEALDGAFSAKRSLARARKRGELVEAALGLALRGQAAAA